MFYIFNPLRIRRLLAIFLEKKRGPGISVSLILKRKSSIDFLFK
jgi:hypothetical protein